MINLNASLVLRFLKVTAGLVLIVVGAGLFVIFTSAINQPQSMGSPMDLGPLVVFTYWPVVLVLDLVFLVLIHNGLKLAGFSGTVFGWILIVIGIGVLIFGIWNHVTGPPIDYDSTRSDPSRVPVPPELNGIVYVWAGVTMIGGLLLVVLTTRARRIN